MRERIIQFGSDGHLTGIACVPEQANGAAVFVNAGIVHRIGPHRLYVKLSRALQAGGMATLRFDLSGSGDSRRPTEPLPYDAQCIADISAANDWLTEKAAGAGITLIGLCSGSEHAYKAALADDRVTALVLLDPHSYSTPLAKMERAAEKIADPDRWARALGRAVGLGGAAALAPNDDGYEAVIDRPDPPRQEWATALSTLLSRGVKIYIRYTRFVEEDLTRPEHFYSAFKDVPGIQTVKVEVDAAADHTYTAQAGQARMIAAVSAWVRETEK